MSTPTELLERVVDVRRAARAIVRSDDPVTARCLGLLDLLTQVRNEGDPETRRWCESVVYEEARPFLEAEDTPPARSGDTYERAQRRLYAEGYSSCPRCLSVVATDVDFDRWRTQREARIGELELRAVPA